MAKQRKRFYVARFNGWGYQILSLKHAPQSILFSFLFSRVAGPYRTFDAACTALHSETKLDAIYLGR